VSNAVFYPFSDEVLQW